MKKDAYLIIAHKQFPLLKSLIQCLDYEYNDIYIHVDKKSKFDFEEIKSWTKKSKIYIFQKYNVQWGTESQVDTEMLLFQKAHESRGYRYYHLLSGQDLPIKPIEEIYHFFDNKETEYLEFGADNNDLYRFRLASFHYRGTNLIGKKFFNYLNRVNGLLRRDRLTKYNMQIYKGSNWASLTCVAVDYLVKHRTFIFRITRHSFCADEVYKQTLLRNAKRSFNINQEEDIRYIDWERHEGTSPHTILIEDYETLLESNCLFARKFDSDVDCNIIEKIVGINR